MATNLVIGWSDVPLSALAFINSHTWGDAVGLSGFHNLRAGYRYQLAELNAAVNATVTNTYDIGSGLTKTSNFLIIARADLLKNNNVSTVTLKGSNDSPTWTVTTTIQTVTLSGETLLGPNATDVVKDFADSAGYRAYKVEYGVSASSSICHSKVYFGSWFDFGDIVDDIKCVKVYPDNDDFKTTSGAVHMARGKVPFYRVTVTWKGATDTQVDNFKAQISHNSDTYPGVFLYTRTNHDILDSKRLLHCRLASFTVPTALKTNYNLVTAVFEEMSE